MKKKNHQSVEVDELPTCDLCTDGTLAHFDALTSQGSWGYPCDTHFTRYGVGLGLGKGQKLILRGSTASEVSGS